VFDIATSWYHAGQTAGVVSGSLVLVRQGAHGALSLMIVGGRRAAMAPASDECTILVRSSL